MKKIHSQNVAELVHYIISSIRRSQVPAMPIQEL